MDRMKSLLGQSGTGPEKVLQEVRKAFTEIKYAKTPFDFEIPEVFRAVSKADEIWFDNVGKVGCVPAEYADLGRCNWKGEPAFYCSNDSHIPLFEVRPKSGEFVVVSGWTSNLNQKQDPDIPIIFNGVAFGVESILKSPQNPSLQKLLWKDDVFQKQTPEVFKDISRCMGELYVKSSDDFQNLYWLTSAIAKVFFDDLAFDGRGSGINGIIYPSVAGEFSGVNTVFTEDFFYRHLRLCSASMYQIIEANQAKNEYKVRAVKSSTKFDKNGNLTWEYSKDKNVVGLFSPGILPQSGEIEPLELEN